MNYSIPAPAIPLQTDLEKRVKLLKDNQKDIAKLLAQYERERHLLKRKQHLEFVQSFYERIGKVVRGEHKPTEREGKWYLDDSEDDDSEEVKGKKEKKPSRKAGIPDYWSTIIQNSTDLVEEHDEPILKHLEDVKCNLIEDGFVLEFTFSPNEYFSNTTLTKTYLLKFTPDEENAFDFVGPKIFKSIGCQIDWKKQESKDSDDEDDEPKKDKSKKKSKKDKKAGKKKKERSAQIPFMERHRKTFFKFFQAPNVAENVKLSDLDPFDRKDMETDFGNGELFIYDLIGNSVNYFTGDALESDDEDSEESSEEESEEEDEEEEENEEKKEDTKKKGFLARLFSK